MVKIRFGTLMLMCLVIFLLALVIAVRADAEGVEPAPRPFQAQCVGYAKGTPTQQLRCNSWKNDIRPKREAGKFYLFQEKAVWYEHGVLHTTSWWKTVELDYRQWEAVN
jgi:hypothetical protein